MSNLRKLLLLIATQSLFVRGALAQEAGPEPAQTGSSLVVVLGLAVLVLVVVVIIFAIRSSKAPAGRPTEAKQHEPVTTPSAPQRTVVAEPRRQGQCVFISYRRGDSADITGRIYDRLAQHFGKEAVFKDVDSIPLGIDFQKHLQGAVGQCSVLLAIIGRSWVDAGSDSGKRRLDDSRDHLRIEIETALRRDIPVIPVLVQGGAIPEADQLPESLKTLAYRNGLSVRPDPDFHPDMDRLIKGIQTHLR